MNRKVVVAFLFLLLVITRFFNLFWGFPYLFHPDEMNMASAVSQMTLQNGLNPQFYAYGQLPLFVAYAITTITHVPPVISLRILSAIASIVTGFILFYYLRKKYSFKAGFTFLLLYTFTPVFIQLSHFGTTESLLVLFFALLLVFGSNPIIAGIVLGMAVGTKLSSAVLICIPMLYLFRKRNFLDFLLFILVFLVSYAFSSPHNLLHFSDFISSMKYEIGVANGSLPVFYTHQFHDAVKVIFPFLSIFPFALGLPLYIAWLISIPVIWKHHRNYVFLWIVVIIPQLLLHAQWTRFYIFPMFVMIIMASLAVAHIKKWIYILIVLQIIAGCIYIFQIAQTDTRIAATKWIQANIPKNSTIQTEAANVYDLPLVNKEDYTIISTFLYTEKPSKIGNWIVIPSRRVFGNYTCEYRSLQQKMLVNCKQKTKDHPELNEYYRKIQRNCKRVHTEDRLLPGEEFAEETWTVFDRPVVRIYKCGK